MKVTSRERPQILLDTVKSYIDKASDTKNMVWLFSFDEDDKSYNNEGFSNSLQSIFPKDYQDALIIYGIGKNKIQAINMDINELNSGFFTLKPNGMPWDILLNISDDQRPIVQGYDDIIRKAMPDDLDASLWFFDGQPRINTQEIIGRVYYERFGYVYHPDFKSLWCDNLSTDLAAYLGKQIKSKQQIVKHINPAWGGSESLKMDALYERNNTFWNEDEATYKRLKAEGLDKLIKK